MIWLEEKILEHLETHQELIEFLNDTNCKIATEIPNSKFDCAASFKYYDYNGFKFTTINNYSYILPLEAFTDTDVYIVELRNELLLANLDAIRRKTEYKLSRIKQLRDEADLLEASLT